MSDIIFIYTTTPSAEVSESLARLLLGEGCVACANILPTMTSLYPWKNKIQKDQESVLILKTEAAYFDLVAELIKENHPYDTPCIVSWKMDQADTEYQKWVQSLLNPLD